MLKSIILFLLNIGYVTTTTPPPTTTATPQPTTTPTSTITPTTTTTITTTSSTTTPPTTSSTTPPTTSSTTPPTTSYTTPPTTGSTTPPTTGYTTQPTTGYTTPPTTGSTTPPTTGYTTQPTTGYTTQPTTSSTTPPNTSYTTPPTTSTTTPPTTSSTTSPTTSTITPTTTTTITTTSSTTPPTTITTQPITISTNIATVMATSDITTIQITEEPPVNRSEVRDSLLNIIDSLVQPEKPISIDTLNNVLQKADEFIEYSTQKNSHNQSEFINDVILITNLIELISQKVYNVTQNSSNDTIRFEMNFIKLQIHLVSKQNLISSNSPNIDISFPTTCSDGGIEAADTVSIPTSLLLSLLSSNITRIVITSSLIQVNLNEEEPLKLNQIASNIFGLSITGIKPGENLEQPIQFKFQTHRFINDPLCSFLNENSVNWSQSGVNLIQTSPNITECETSHLTIFAVLAGSTIQYSPTENLILHILSYVLLTISLIFLLVSLGAFFLSSRFVFKLEANIMYFNYGLALTLAIFTFLLGAELHRLKSSIPCIIISLFIHYIWLVVFASSTALSVLILYATWLSSIKSERRFIAPYLIVAAWSIPLIITVAMGVPMLIAETDINGNPSFLTKNSCILSSVIENRDLNWYTIPFYVLIFIMIIVNTVILMLTLFKIYKVLKKRSESHSKSSHHHLLIFRTMVKSALILLPILGVPWIITPIIAYTPNVDFLSTFFDWIFILLNCPVGIVFFAITIKIEEIKFPLLKKKPPTSNTNLISSKPIKECHFVVAKLATINSTTLPIASSTILPSTTATTTISNKFNLNTDIYKYSITTTTTILANPNTENV